MGTYRGSRGTILYDKVRTDHVAGARYDYAAPDDGATLAINSIAGIENSTADTNTAALFVIPTPTAGAWLDLIVTAYTTAGTDSIKCKCGTGVSIGANSTEDVITFGAVAQYACLRGVSATKWMLVSASTGVSLAAST